MKFKEFNGKQLSPEWFELRLGKVTGSRLGDWLAVSKRDGKTPLKARLDYEKELVFEKKFNKSFEKFVTKAMELGREYEDYIAEQYALITGNKVLKCGAYYNDKFVSSPDRLVNEDGLLEIKLLGDNSFSDVLTNGVPNNYSMQCEAEIMASGRKWCDFAAYNINTKSLIIIRVERDEEMIKKIADSLSTPITFSFDEEMLSKLSHVNIEIDQPKIADEVSW